MASFMEKNLHILRSLASQRSISIAEELSEIREDDIVAEIGLLSYKLNVPQYLALSENLEGKDPKDFMENGANALV